MQDERDGTDIDVGTKERATSTVETRHDDPTTSGKVSADNWEKMMRTLYAYRLGMIGFLDMLAAWEDILGIARPPTTNQL